MKFTQNLPSEDWVRSFVKRNNLTSRLCQNITRKRSQVSPEIFETYFNNLAQTIDGVAPQNIMNYDETNLSDDPGEKKCLFRRGVKYPERIMNSTKASTSVMFSATANGELLPTYVVYKAVNLMNTWTEGGPAKVRYNRTKSGWFDSVTFEDWFFTVVVPWAKKLNRKKVIIGDNLSSHLSPQVVKACERENIAFVCLPPNSTHLCQPLDVAVYSSLKIHWRAVLSKWKLGPGKNKPTLPKDLFPNQLRKLLESMGDCMQTNILSGFRKCGICPLDRNQVLGRLPRGAGDRQHEESANQISEAFLHNLNALRYPENDPVTKRRKRVNVEAGKSITASDFVNDRDNPAEPVPGPSNGDAEMDDSVASEAVAESDDATDCEDNDVHDSDEPAASDTRVFAVGQWVLAKYETSKHRQVHYVATIIAENDESDPDYIARWHVQLLRKSTKMADNFFKPNIEDFDDMDDADIVRILPDATVRRGHYSFGNTKFPEYNLQ